MNLTPAQATQLSTVGRTLVSDRTWWGDSENAEPTDRSVVQFERITGGKYKVRVHNLIGAIGLGELQLVIQPKIPLTHLVYLLAQSNQVPRAATERADIASDTAFADLVVRWFIGAIERLLRLGLDKDYEHTIDDLGYAKGRIHALPTLRSVHAGRPVIRCEFDTFDEDTSLNRVLKAAVLRVLSNGQLALDLRRRARSVCMRLDGAGPLRGRDITVVPDARSGHYRDAHRLAVMVLAASGIGVHQGLASMWTFLYRTPESVEEGVRATLKQHLDPAWPVTKKGKSLEGSRNRRLQPDLVFGNQTAVGDVKYRMTSSGDITRSNLNQVTTFATGYGANKALVLGFGNRHAGEHVKVGDVYVSGMNWNTAEPDPERAGIKLASLVTNWLES